jgi:hypothetical protein
MSGERQGVSHRFFPGKRHATGPVASAIPLTYFSDYAQAGSDSAPAGTESTPTPQTKPVGWVSDPTHGVRRRSVSRVYGFHCVWTIRTSACGSSCPVFVGSETQPTPRFPGREPGIVKWAVPTSPDGVKQGGTSSAPVTIARSALGRRQCFAGANKDKGMTFSSILGTFSALFS